MTVLNDLEPCMGVVDGIDMILKYVWRCLHCLNKYKYTNTQIHKYKFAHTNTNTLIRIQIHKYTYTQIHRSSELNRICSYDEEKYLDFLHFGNLDD